MSGHTAFIVLLPRRLHRKLSKAIHLAARVQRSQHLRAKARENFPLKSSKSRADALLAASRLGGSRKSVGCRDDDTRAAGVDQSFHVTIHHEGYRHARVEIVEDD